MNRTDRLYALVEELRAEAPRPRSARQLAERYEVSTRTIERDILALQESGVPIYAETGRSGGYAIDKALTLPPLNFSAAEMVAIAVALAREGAHAVRGGHPQRAAQGAGHRVGRADRGGRGTAGPGPADRRGPPGGLNKMPCADGGAGLGSGGPRAAARPGASRGGASRPQGAGPGAGRPAVGCAALR